MYGDELGLTSEDDADYVCPTRITLSSLNDISPPLSMNCGTLTPRSFDSHAKAEVRKVFCSVFLIKKSSIYTYAYKHEQVNTKFSFDIH